MTRSDILSVTSEIKPSLRSRRKGFVSHSLSEIVFTGQSISKDRLFLKYKRYLLHICDRIAMLVRK